MDIRKKKINIYLTVAILLIAMLFCSVCVIMDSNKTTHAIIAEDIESQSTNLSEILLAGYENSTTGKVFSGDVFWELVSQISGEKNPNKGTLDNLTMPKTSADFRTNNNELGNGTKDVVLQIGGKQWIATYLSTNSSGDPILTLWLANSEILSSWHVQAEASTSNPGKYPNNMYGTSSIRAVTLNNGGGYAKTYNATSLTPVEQDPDSEWAIYTMDGVAGSLTSFIEVPDNMSWQHDQKALDNVTSSAYKSEFGYNNNNDALDVGGNGKAGDYLNDSKNNTVDKAGYKGWANDMLWLPSVAETGVRGEEGIWKAINTTRANDVNVWLRSAGYPSSHNTMYFLGSAGSNISRTDALSSRAVRPAFHLNLAKVAESATAATPKTKGDVKKYYSETGGVADEIEFELDKVNSNFTDITIQATDIEGNSITSPTHKITEGVLSFKASQVGKYVVKVTPKTNEYWSDGTNESKEYTYYLKYHVTPMAWKDGKNTSPYNGEKQYFEVENYDEDKMTVTPALEKIPEGKPNAGKWGVAVKDYTDKSKVKVELKNKEFMEWTDDNTTTAKESMTYSITKKAMTGTSATTDVWSVEVNTADKKYDVYIDCIEADIEGIRFEGYYQKDGSTAEEKIPTQLTAVKDGDKIKVTVTLPSVSEKGTYKYGLRLKSGIEANNNYTFTFTQTFKVESKKVSLKEEDIIWRYTNGKVGSGYTIVDKSKLDSEKIYNLDYNGEEYVFDVDTSKLSDAVEYTVEGEKSGTNVKINGSTVGYYTATLKITAKAESEGIEIETSEFTLKWRINKAKFDLSGAKWVYYDKTPTSSEIEYKGALGYAEKYWGVKISGLPEGLTFEYDAYAERIAVGKYTASVDNIKVAESVKDNYIKPDKNNEETYIYEVEGKSMPWSLDWEIKKGELELEWEKKRYEDSNARKFSGWEVSGNYAKKIEYRYYKEGDYNTETGEVTGESIDIKDIKVVPETEEIYYVVAVLNSANEKNYEIKAGSGYKKFTVGTQAPIREIDMESKFTYDGAKHGEEKDWKVESSEHILAKYYRLEEEEGEIKEILLSEAPIDAGKYVVKFDIEEGYEEIFELSVYKIEYEIVKAKIKVEWESKGEKPELKGLSEAEKEKIEYEYRDENGNAVAESELENGKTYKVIAKIKSEYRGNYEFVDLEGNVLTEPSESGEYEFKYDDGSEEPGNPDDPNTPVNPDDPTNPDNPNNPEEPTDEPKPGTTIDDILDKVKDLPLWQLIASGISIILIIAFLSKTASNESKRKKAKKVMEKKYNTFYATAFLGISVTNWTVIASVLMGSAVLSLIFMVISQKRRNKAEEELEDAKDEYNKMMFMRMNGNGNMQGQNYGYSAQPAVGIEDMRCMINDAVSAMLPNVQQYLPQQASANDELVQRLIEQNEQNKERIKQLTEENKETINRMSERNDERIERFLQKLSEQKVAEKEVAATITNDETIKQLLKNQEMLIEQVQELKANQQAEKAVETSKQIVKEERVEERKEKAEETSIDKIDALIKTNESLMRNQEMLMKQIIELSSSKGNDKPIIVQQPAPQIVEKEVRVEVPVEKIVEKTVPIEVEKVVEKIVEIPAQKPAPKAKATAPRLTLDEAYAKLSKQQKKFFDTLKEYAMSKEKCKEKKSTYYILLGQSSVNPLVKLTIKKDCTVALFKMEDEYMKDIRRNAGSEGTKVKVKETELIVGDSQALATAKEMIDLREDQIERYNDYFKEQRSMKKR